MMEAKNVIINNLNVSYFDVGENELPAIVFIHGFPFNKSMWETQILELKNEFRVIAYDVRGHGDSDIGTDDFSIEIFVTDLIALLKELRIDKVTVCGLSMGGYIALNAITTYPEKFSALILSDTSCIADSDEAKANRKKTINDIDTFGVVQYAEKSIEKLFSSESINNKPHEVTAIKEMILQTSMHSLTQTLQALANRSATCGRLSNINVPVLILVGSEDKLTPLALSQKMQDEIESSNLYVIENSGHLPNIENPQKFNELIHNFLNTQKDNNTNEIQPQSENIQSVKTSNYDPRESVLNEKILSLTLTIKEKYPELSKYIEEMPETIPSDQSPEVTLQKLRDYCESLQTVLDQYGKTHQSKGN